MTLPWRGFETNLNETDEFFATVKVSDTTMSNRNSAARNKNTTMCISTDDDNSNAD
ncbi:MAG: hypothetical protein JWQ09_3031 [Segetibacter sp.]|nr:hypothetical protein [Segetibacter sp.]